MICNHDFDYFREVIDYDCDYIVFSMNVIDYDYEFAIVIVIVPTIAITDYDYPMPGFDMLVLASPVLHPYLEYQYFIILLKTAVICVNFKPRRRLTFEPRRR